MKAKKGSKGSNAQPRSSSGNGSSGSPTEPTVRDPSRAEPGHILVALAGIPRLSTFASAIRSAGLTEMFTGHGRSTVFAPMDSAFAKLTPTELEELFADRPRLIEMVERHVVHGRVNAPRSGVPMRITPLAGGGLMLSARDGGYLLDNARVVRTNIRASNGIIHVIDAVLSPP